MFRAISPAMTTSMIMALGVNSRGTGMFGIPTTSARTGRLIATDTGTGSILGDGPGWAMSLGVLRLTTTAAGRSSAGGGVGAPDRTTVTRFTGRHLSAGSAEAGGFDSGLAWAGSRWG